MAPDVVAPLLKGGRGELRKKTSPLCVQRVYNVRYYGRRRWCQNWSDVVDRSENIECSLRAHGRRLEERDEVEEGIIYKFLLVT